MSRVVGSRAVHLWSLHEDVVVEEDATGQGLVLRSRFGTERISRPDPLVREALRRMELGPVLLANVVPRASAAAEGATESAAAEDASDDASDDATDGATDDASDDASEGAYLVLLPVLDRLSHLIVRTLSWEDLRGPLLSVVSTSKDAPFAPVTLSARRLIRLIGDVSLTLEKAGFALARGTSPHRVQLHRPEAVWVVGLLAWPATPSHASSVLPLPPEVTQAVLSYLAAAGMTEDCGEPVPHG
ncbi:NADH oxidase [Streptomyces sp. NPDC015684]|uniref:NADH oxidase n=1 Tax=Streptomyces sp. NPDC015684 TaxID=3364963 RepID=UPI0036FA0C60